MSLTEEDRHDLYSHLVDVLGRKDASTLMEHLPPVGWADVATKTDLSSAIAQVRADIKADIHEAITNQTRTFIMSMAAVMVSQTGLILGILQFALK